MKKLFPGLAVAMAAFCAVTAQANDYPRGPVKMVVGFAAGGGTDIAKALRVAFNAKCHRYGTCNTMETLLVAREIAPRVLPELAKLNEQKEVELRGDDEARAILKDYPHLATATADDWKTEYLAAILAVKIVPGIDEAIAHINLYSSQHTDAIITEDYSRAMRFVREVDSASVMVNASICSGVNGAKLLSSYASAPSPKASASSARASRAPATVGGVVQVGGQLGLVLTLDGVTLCVLPLGPCAELAQDVVVA